MTRRHAPRRGSIAFRPRVRAKKETPSFSSFPPMKGPAKPMNFFGYKVGMIHLIAKSLHDKGKMSKLDMQIPSTVVECPPMHVYGVRAYEHTPHGLRVVGETTVEKLDKHAMERNQNFKRKHEHKRNTATKNKTEATKKTISDFETMKATLHSIRLLVHTQPSKTNFGKKKSEMTELALSGTIDEQLAYAKEKFGKVITIQDVFKDGSLTDVKAVTRGFGFGGVVARFGVKTFRPKAKYIRTVGSISPLRPGTVQFTVARPGQLGYHNRTEFNKKILKVLAASDAAKINPKSGFEHYGVIQNDYIIIAGSIPGPVKRLVGIREPVRPEETGHYKIGPITLVSTTGGAL